MLFLRNTGPENYQHLSPDQRQQVVKRWNDWYDRLARAGKAVEGQPLEFESRVVTSERVTDGPFAEAKESIAGFVKLMVGSLEEATEIAQQHPGLEHGLIIEVRPMNGQCHLGVNHHPSAELAAV